MNDKLMMILAKFGSGYILVTTILAVILTVYNFIKLALFTKYSLFIVIIYIVISYIVGNYLYNENN